MTSGLVSVIVVSWNSRTFLPDCLASVTSQSWPDVELIVVDNASTDGSARFVREAFPDARLIQNQVNAGFCAANNAGLKEARGAYILFLNSDAILQPTYIEEALRSFAQDDAVGMVAGKVLRFDGRTLDTAGQLLTRGRRVKERGYGRPDRGQYDSAGEVFSVCGAVALYRRRTVEDISLDGEFFDEDFFAFCEDLDAGWRARNRGWVCLYQPRAVARHFRGGTQQGGRPGVARRLQMARRPAPVQAHIVMNRYLTMIKNESARSFAANLPFILAWDLVVWSFLLIFSPAAIPLVWARRDRLGRAFRKRRALRSRPAMRAAV